MRDRLYNAWWWLSLRLRPAQTVLWGGRPVLDRQLGDPEDLRLAHWRRVSAARSRQMRQLTESMQRVTVQISANAAPAMQALERSSRQAAELLAEFGERYRESMRASASALALGVDADMQRVRDSALRAMRSGGR